MSSNSINAAKSEVSFWKPNLRALPGRVTKVETRVDEPAQDLPPTNLNGSLTRGDSLVLSMPLSPTKKHTKKGSSSADSSFQQYAESTQDAWDDDTDDPLLAKLRLDSNIIQKTASQVIDSHNNSNTGGSSSNAASAPPPVQKTETPASNVSATQLQKNHHSQTASSNPRTSKSNPQHNGNKVPASSTKSVSQTKREHAKLQKFKSLLDSSLKNLDELQSASWSGIPSLYRPVTWKILCGYLPAAVDRRKLALERKRKEYFSSLEQYFHTRLEDQHQDTFRQIHIDVPRMNPLIPLFQNKQVQEIFERILYIWAIRHPASGYVQGINDLVTPFFVVFLTEFIDSDHPLFAYTDINNVDSEFKTIEISSLSQEQLDNIEADCYWCMSKLLDGIQDNYTFAQPGIQKKVAALKELTLRIDANLHNHIESQGIEFLQFTFRWMNNLLMRELPLRCTIRLWDTYLAEPDGFAHYHLYVCAAFLTKFSKQLQQEHDFQGLMTKLQNLPTHNWQDSDIEELTAEAYRLKYMFADAPQHFKQKT